MPLPFGCTSHDFLIAFYPDHDMHTILCVDDITTPHLTFHCSCGQHLGVMDTQLEAFGTSAKKAINKTGPLRNVPVKGKA